MKRFSVLVFVLFVGFVFGDEKISEEKSFSAAASIIFIEDGFSYHGRNSPALIPIYWHRCKNKTTQEEANNCALEKCKSRRNAGDNRKCIIYREGTKNVFKENKNNYFDKFESLHMLAVGQIHIKNYKDYLYDQTISYDCGLENTSSSDFKEILKSSKKEFFYKVTSNNLRGNYCAFDNSKEAIKAMQFAMLACIERESDTCAVSGTGNKSGGWIMHGKNEIEVSQFLKDRNQKIAKIEKQRELEKKEADYIAQKRNTCIKYGFKKDADIAECVRKSIADDKANEIALKKIKEENQTKLKKERQEKLKEEQKLAQQQLLLQQQQQALIYQQQQGNQARSNCYATGKTLQGGIAGALDIIGNCNNNPYGNSNANQVCNFKHWNGLVIQGDCSQSSIILGNEVYQKIQ